MPLKEECSVCRAPGTLTCSNCNSATYCCEQHQTEDWPNHKKECPAYKVVSSAEGSYVVATRDINEGEVIATETPLVLGPSNVEAVPQSCLGCFLSLKRPLVVSARCPGCGWPVCSANCPGLKDPAYHGAECEVLTAVQASVKSHPFESIVLLRCLLQQKHCQQKWCLLRDMAKQAQAISKRSEKRKAEIFFEENILQPLASTAPHLIPDCSPSLVKEIYSLLDTFGLPGKMFFSGLLVAVTPIASRMEHSCVPNTRLFFKALSKKPASIPVEKLPESHITVRAATKIRKAQHLTTYFLSSPVMDTLIRQKTLSTLRNESCTCPRCTDPTELGTNFRTLKCGIGTCGGWVVPVDPLREDTKWKCSKKSCRFSGYPVDFVLERTSSYVEVARRLEYQRSAPTVLELEKAVSDLESFLHPHHLLCIFIKNQLIKTYAEYKDDGSFDLKALTDAHLDRNLALCVELLEVLLKPSFMREPTNKVLQECLARLVKTKLEIMERKVSRGQWSRACTDIVRLKCYLLFKLAKHIATAFVSEQPWYKATNFVPDQHWYDKAFDDIKRCLHIMKM